jgi:hypothetical protein
MRRSRALVVALSLSVVVASCSSGGKGPTGSTAATTSTVASTAPASSMPPATTTTTVAASTVPSTRATTSTAPTTSPAVTLLHVDSVAMTVAPASIAGLVCGTKAKVVYTATFRLPAGHAAGTIRFTYTTSNGRGDTPATLPVAAGARTATYSFSWQGDLPDDHTYPTGGGVSVTSPNTLTSSLVAPSGACAAPAAFQVTSIDMAVRPTTVSGLTCGTSLTVRYTATFHVPAHTLGGPITFEWTTTNGRGTTPASVTVPPLATTATYSWSVQGAVSPDHVFPSPGSVMLTSPNPGLQSPAVGPTGACTP